MTQENHQGEKATTANGTSPSGVPDINLAELTGEKDKGLEISTTIAKDHVQETTVATKGTGDFPKQLPTRENKETYC